MVQSGMGIAVNIYPKKVCGLFEIPLKIFGALLKNVNEYEGKLETHRQAFFKEPPPTFLSRHRRKNLDLFVHHKPFKRDSCTFSKNWCGVDFVPARTGVADPETSPLLPGSPSTVRCGVNA